MSDFSPSVNMPEPARDGFAHGPHNLGAVTLLARLAQEALADPLGELGLTFAQAIAMVRLWQSPNGQILQSEMIEKLVLSRASGSLVLQELEQAGFITRSVDPVDARRLSVRLTNKGRDIEPAVHATFEQQEKCLFPPIDSGPWDTTYQTLRSAIQTLIEERNRL